MIRPSAKVVNEIRRLWLTETRVVDIAKSAGVSANTIYKWMSAGWLGDLKKRTAGVKPNKKPPTGKIMRAALALWNEYGDRQATAKAMGVSYDTLQKWERSGLVSLPDRGGRKRKRIGKVQLPDTKCMMDHRIGSVSVRLCSRCIHLLGLDCEYYVTSVEQQLYGLHPYQVWERGYKELERWLEEQYTKS